MTVAAPLSPRRSSTRSCAPQCARRPCTTPSRGCSSCAGTSWTCAWTPRGSCPSRTRSAASCASAAARRSTTRSWPSAAWGSRASWTGPHASTTPTTWPRPGSSVPRRRRARSRGCSRRSWLRRTDRTAFATTPVPAGARRRPGGRRPQAGTHLIAEQQPDRVLALEGVVARADTAQRRDLEPAAGAGRLGAQGPARRRRTGRRAARARARPRVLLRPARLRARTGRPSPGSGEPPVAEHPLLLVLSTEATRPRTGPGRALPSPASCSPPPLPGWWSNPQTQVLEVAGPALAARRRAGPDRLAADAAARRGSPAARAPRQRAAGPSPRCSWRPPTRRHLEGDEQKSAHAGTVE